MSLQKGHKRQTPRQKLIVKRLTVYLDPAIDAQIRRRAAVADRSLSTEVERALRAYLVSNGQSNRTIR